MGRDQFPQRSRRKGAPAGEHSQENRVLLSRRCPGGRRAAAPLCAGNSGRAGARPPSEPLRPISADGGRSSSWAITVATAHSECANALLPSFASGFLVQACLRAGSSAADRAARALLPDPDEGLRCPCNDAASIRPPTANRACEGCDCKANCQGWGPPSSP